MAIKRAAAFGFAIAGLLLCLPMSALAQGSGGASVAGVVKDASGAVLPGVTVEASSPVLIEKVRSAVTDARALPARRAAPGHLHRDVHAARVHDLKREGSS